MIWNCYLTHTQICCCCCVDVGELLWYRWLANIPWIISAIYSNYLIPVLFQYFNINILFLYIGNLFVLYVSNAQFMLHMMHLQSTFLLIICMIESAHRFFFYCACIFVWNGCSIMHSTGNLYMCSVVGVL